MVGSTGTPGIPGGTVSNRRATDISTLGSSQVADDEDEEDEAVSQPRGRNSQPAEDTLVLASNDDEDDDEITLVPADQEPAKISKPTKFYPPNPDWKGIAAAIEDNGYSELLDATLQYALDSGHKEARSIATYEAEDESHRYWWFSNALPSLACVRRDALNLLIAGNFARAIHEHEEMRNDRDTPSDVRRQYDLHEYVAAYKHRSARQPSIYQLSLVDQDGYSPTMTEIQALIKELRSYEGMHQRFRERHRAIDRMYDPRLSKVKDPDYRKYIHESERPSQRCRIMRAFSDELEKRWISAIKAGVDDTDKFPHTLTYVGYALNAVIREKQHLQTGSPGTNWLSSLCVSILNYLFKGRDDVREPFRMELHVISFIGSEPGASMAEMLFGIITSSYYWTGLGFNVAFCGNSVLSIELKGKSDSEKRKLREDWAAYLVDSTPMPDNLKWSAKARERLVEKEAGRCRELLRNLNFADNPGMRVRLESLLQSYEEDEGDVAISTKRRRA